MSESIISIDNSDDDEQAKENTPKTRVKRRAFIQDDDEVEKKFCEVLESVKTNVSHEDGCDLFGKQVSFYEIIINLDYKY